jgi:hypothetical protein
MNTVVAQATERLLDCVESADYAGCDPYDALNSPVIQRVPSRRSDRLTSHYGTHGSAFSVFQFLSNSAQGDFL